MKAHTASLANAIVLIGCSLWAFVAIDGNSWTALIPGTFGIALLLCFRGIRAENKMIAHIGAVLTLVILIALYMPLSSALESGALDSIIRSLAMVISTIISMVFFIKSFRDARRARTG